MITSLLRLGIGRTLSPFVFESDSATRELDLDVPHLGAYVHVPFCEQICPFCPYYKVTGATSETIERYTDAVVAEISAVFSNRATRPVLSSVYFGGGSPALAGPGLRRVLDALRAHADIAGDIGVELHPRDVTPANCELLREAGFTMASVGVQSFSERALDALGRSGRAAAAVRAVEELTRHGFNAIDVDLIFGIPGQSAEELRADFTRAAQLGATQISTYPFIDFSYADNRTAPAPESQMRTLMAALVSISGELGFERGSVWTFRRAGTPAYSSITRDNFVGFGASAGSLLRSEFKINVFSVDRYVEQIERGGLATAYTLRFTKRTRAAYWLFWSSYTLDIGSQRFRELFGTDLDSVFGGWLHVGQALGLVRATDSGYTLTSRGTYLYHLAEQNYTHQYIDKTWNAAMSPVPPARIVLW